MDDDSLDTDVLNEKFDRDAGVDTGTDWTALGLSDEEISRRLQIAETLPGNTPIASIPVISPQYEQLTKDYESARLSQFKAESEAKRERQSAEASRRIDEEQLRQERRRRMNAEDAAERARRTTYTPYSSTYVAVPYTRTKYIYDSDLGDRLYRWALDLLPDYNILEAARKRSLANKLDRFITQRLRENLSESEVENRIRRLLESESDRPIIIKSRSKSRKRASKSQSRSKRRSKKSTRKR